MLAERGDCNTTSLKVMFSSSLSLAKTHFTMKYNSRNQSLQSADVFLALIYPVGIYLLKVNTENTRAICNVSSQSTLSSFHTLLRSSRPEVYCKKVFLEISKNPQENTYASVSFLIKLHASGLQLY